MTSFVSVATGAARYQDISMNPQKLAGQCAKLKCCINYEVDAYVEAQKRLPSREIVLETKDNNYYHFKTDIFKREITYSTDKAIAANLITITAQRAFDVINMNKKGIKPVSLEADAKQQPQRNSHDILGQDSVTRFDNVSKKKKKKKGNGGNPNGNNPANERPTPNNGNNQQAQQPKTNKGGQGQEPKFNNKNRQQRPKNRSNEEKQSGKEDGQQPKAKTSQAPNNNVNGNKQNANRPVNNKPKEKDAKQDN